MTTAIYRTDSFSVPAAARAEFLERVGATHAVLRRQPGFVRDLILEQPGDDGTSRIVTVAEWRDDEAIRAAKAVVGEEQRRMGFDPRELIARLGITAEFGTYRALAL